ncbi:sugar phosphate isomerase/epimerase family protein [Salinicola avicenniae]|uniref:sugar phosphate isomerase/epimerase family protein n=1 Tax=Salinicola avicenniae TaxID=2916836 RepID=UPI0020731FA5|nr:MULTISPECIES: sugar phosphate isomerase/epimerase family protein [unclassified Salinicola]
MSIGLCTWTLGLDDLDLLMDKVAELGFDGVQINDLWERDTPSDIRRALDRRNLRLMAVDAQRVIPESGQTPTPAAGIDAYRRVIDIAAELEAPYVTLPLLSFWVQGQAEPFAALVEACRELADHAATRGPQLLYEVVNRDEVPMIHDAEAGNRLVRDVDRDNLRLILDSYHMYFEERDPVAAIEASRESLGIYHISDSTRGGIGSGSIDFRAQYDALNGIGFEGPVIMECLPPMHDPGAPVSSDGNRRILEDELSRSLEIWRSFAA